MSIGIGIGVGVIGLIIGIVSGKFIFKADVRQQLEKAKQLKEIKKRSPYITAYIKRVTDVLTERFE